MPDDLKILQERPGFVIFTQAEILTLLSLLLAGLFLWDIVARALEWFRG